ncbi:hypothetical protein [Sulfidibacter corallicola]|uniref:Uncharacterized protein n=1 Tax=Sulfidibacter corallicola TaxID=2818388 RepID=A0A8A4THJ2_SULCO|nr:hypothetical protein [Sulfidibacter corallicola]QTD48281.1 hypothetical protein J3U87_22100 [Sulfidibacter corallicola]
MDQCPCPLKVDDEGVVAQVANVDEGVGMVKERRVFLEFEEGRLQANPTVVNALLTAWLIVELDQLEYEKSVVSSLGDLTIEGQDVMNSSPIWVGDSNVSTVRT